MHDVIFATHNPVILRDMLNPEIRDNPVAGKGKLFLPPGAAPGSRLPAMVVLEGLGGLKDEREIAYGRDLSADGYAVLVVDTFGTRDADLLDDTTRALTVTEAMMLADAFGGLRFLRQHPAVDPDRIGVMGFSYGGMITVLAAYDQMRRLMAPDLPGFAAHASYYGCSIPRLDDPTATGAPVLIQIGAKDRNVSVERTERIAGDLRRGGAEVELVVHDAWHQWDGMDIEKRFVRWSLEGLHLRVDKDCNVMRESLPPVPMVGAWSRRTLIAMGVRPTGYHIMRDEQVEEESYAILLRFLEKSMQAMPASVRPPAAGAVARSATG